MQRLVISHVAGALQKADLGTKGFDVPKFRELVNLWGILPLSEEVSNVALRAMRATTSGGVFMFVLLCVLLVRGAAGAEETKEDLPLDGSIEFYGMMMLCIIAAVAVWEALKRMAALVHKWWMGCQKRKKKLERLRNRAQAAVQEELQRQRAPMSPMNYGAASSGGPASATVGTPPRGMPMNTPPRAGQEATPIRASWTTSSRGSSQREGRMSTTRPAMFSTSSANRSPGDMPDQEVTSVSRGTQTNPGDMLPTNRLQGFEGPYYITANGDRMHLAAYCHGQRNATRASKAYQVCQYCARDRPLFEVTPDRGL